MTQPLSGVQRYAREILGALDRLLSDRDSGFDRIEVLLPRPVEAPDWKGLNLRVIPGGDGHFWEQVTLARAARDGRLLSLGNAGPMLHPDHVVCLHDAHLFDMPEAFSKPYRLWHRTLRPVLARRARGLVTVSDHSACRLAHHLGVKATQFDIIPNSAEHVLQWPTSPDAPTRYGLQRGAYLLCVGNQSPNKNLDALIKAHATLGASVPPLALVGGDVPGVATVDTTRGSAVHLGRVPDTDLRGLYDGAAGFVFPSLNEGFGIPPLEAMELGVPVICARSGAMPDVLGDAPMWFDPRNGADMARAMGEFSKLSQPARAAMVVRGKTVAAQYRWHDSAARLLAVVQRGTAVRSHSAAAA